MKKPTTGKYSYKPYRCTRCGKEESHGTNHWGQIYCRCSGCSWKNPMDPTAVFECLEPVPKGYGIPAPWKKVKLSDLVEIR